MTSKTLLLDGSEVEDPRLDRLYPGLERHWSSLNYLAVRGTPLEQRALRTNSWSLQHWLDQGSEGRCVEYSICHEMLARPVLVDPEKVDNILAEKAIYWPAQQEDQWAGGSYPGANPFYEGTSVLSGIKVAARLGYYREYRWGLDARDLALVIGYHGPAVLGINWYEGMYDADQDGYIHVSGNIAGGHAILCKAVRIKRVGETVDYDSSYFTLHNSWGTEWGVQGTAKVSWYDMERLISEEGEVCVPVRRSSNR